MKWLVSIGRIFQWLLDSSTKPTQTERERYSDLQFVTFESIDTDDDDDDTIILDSLH